MENAEGIMVSVHMITYNHEKYIEQAITGVLMQEVNFVTELVISDDCSTDNTGDIIARIIKDHPKGNLIKYYPQAGRLGMMPNFHFTLQKCNGKYLAICEGDDYWTDPLKIQKQVAILEANPAYSLVFTNRTVLKDNQATDVYYEKEYEKNIFNTADVIQGFVPGMQTILSRNFKCMADYFAANPGYRFGDRYLAYFCSLFGNLYLLAELSAAYRMTGAGVWSVNAPIEKLHTYTSFMKEFHQSLGLPPNNIILSRINYKTSVTTLRYCLKRPKFFLNKQYRQIIVRPFNS